MGRTFRHLHECAADDEQSFPLQTAGMQLSKIGRYLARLLLHGNETPERSLGRIFRVEKDAAHIERYDGNFFSRNNSLIFLHTLMSQLLPRLVECACNF